jgi:DNA (cytosine-5)-methyltransferase 1
MQTSGQPRAPAVAPQPAVSFIDVCCGGGGFTRGLIDAGLHHVAGYDIDPLSIETYNANFPGAGMEGNLRTLSLPRHAADVLVAGLPCQGHSTIGKRARWDGRNKLWSDFARLVHDVQPWAGAVENVVPFLYSRAFRQLEQRLIDLGYFVVHGIVSATAFGVAQRRERALLLFAMGAEPVFPHGDTSTLPTVRKALVGLPLAPNGLNDHAKRGHSELSLRRYAHVKEGGSRIDLPVDLQSPCWKALGSVGATNSFGRLWWDRPADTIRTAFLKPETGRYIHPSENRGLTIREGARLQGFKDDFVFCGTVEEKARQIGNAVPPPIAMAVGVELLRVVEEAQSTQQALAA